MKKTAFITAGLLFSFLSMLAQESSQNAKESWVLSADANFYFIPDDFFMLPVLRADKNKLHLEARYNYEERETFSAWAGYNFSGGNEFEFAFTPMLGGVVGQINGIAPGLELSLNYRGFELYSESELFLDTEFEENNYYYNWSDLSFTPNERVWFGLSAQRTRLYQTELEIQRGIFAGGAYKNWELTGYLYNVFFDDGFVLGTLSYNF